MPSNKKLPPIRLTQEGAASQLGVAAATLRKGLNDLDISFPPGATTLPLRIWVKAITGDAQAERTRLTREHADLMAINRLRIAGEVVSLGDVHEHFGRVLAAFRSQILEAPSALSYTLNPSDPEHARIVMQDWVTRLLTSTSDQIRAFVPPSNVNGTAKSSAGKTTKRVAPRTLGVVGRAAAASSLRKSE